MTKADFGGPSCDGGGGNEKCPATGVRSAGSTTSGVAATAGSEWLCVGSGRTARRSCRSWTGSEALLVGTAGPSPIASRAWRSDDVEKDARGRPPPPSRAWPSSDPSELASVSCVDEALARKFDHDCGELESDDAPSSSSSTASSESKKLAVTDPSAPSPSASTGEAELPSTREEDIQEPSPIRRWVEVGESLLRRVEMRDGSRSRRASGCDRALRD